MAVRFLVYGCIRKFDKGSEHLVYAFNDNKGWLRMYCCCTRSRQLVDAGEDVKEFKDRGEEPKPIIMNKTLASQSIPTSNKIVSGLKKWKASANCCVNPQIAAGYVKLRPR